MSDLVGNPEDRFSRVTAQMIKHYFARFDHLNVTVDVFDMVILAVDELFSFVVCPN